MPLPEGLTDFRLFCFLEYERKRIKPLFEEGLYLLEALVNSL
jgi:hypothetical protein